MFQPTERFVFTELSFVRHFRHLDNEAHKEENPYRGQKAKVGCNLETTTFFVCGSVVHAEVLIGMSQMNKGSLQIAP